MKALLIHDHLGVQRLPAAQAPPITGTRPFGLVAIEVPSR